MALNKIAASQATPTKQTSENITMLLYYKATYPDAKIRYTASEIILPLDSDTTYLVAPKIRSYVAGYVYCGAYYTTHTAPTTVLNEPIHIECKLLKHVVALTAEAKTAGLFHNFQATIHIRHTLEALCHSQPATPS